jgi:hypothetical protein
LPQNISSTRLVDLAKMRSRIERDYQELKQEVGLGHFEGRGWRGFHHHATLCIAAYGFLISEREAIPPLVDVPRRPQQTPRVPKNYRPRGSAAQDRASHPELDHYNAPTIGRSMRADNQIVASPNIAQFMTQQKTLNRSNFWDALSCQTPIAAE